MIELKNEPNQTITITIKESGEIPKLLHIMDNNVEEKIRAIRRLKVLVCKRAEKYYALKEAVDAFASYHGESN